MFENVDLFSCDHPGCSVGHGVLVKFYSIEHASSEGWAISRYWLLWI